LAENEALKSIVFNPSVWIAEAVQLAEEKRKLAWLCRVGNRKKLIRVVLE
jgi:hypothetical protein